MFELRCPVRKCRKPLSIQGTALTCDAAHNFDRAKEGYWNLTQPQDKKSANPGDSDSAVTARHRWLSCGHASGLVDLLRSWTGRFNCPNGLHRVVDLGCGEGTFGKSLFEQNAAGFCGIDLSRKAIRLAAKSFPQATWVLANADRTLPIVDRSIDLVMSLFGRRPSCEIDRILADQGQLIVAIPGEKDLIELREIVQQSGRRFDRSGAVVEEMSKVGLECFEQRRWTAEVLASPGEIADALAMTYRAERNSEKKRLDGVSEMKVTLSADLMIFKRSSAG